MKGLTREDFDALTLIGQQMSTLCFNLGQGYRWGGKNLEADTLKSMYDLDRQWSAKLSDIRQKVRDAKRRAVKAK